MNRKFTYPVKLIKQKEGGYLVKFPDLPEAITQADTIDEALLEAYDCLEEAVANRMAMQMAIPEAREIRSKQHSILLPATLAAKAALYIAMRSMQLSNTALAKNA